MSTNKPRIVNRESTLHVGGMILAAQLAGQRDPSAINPGHLDRLADLSVTAALALDAAIPRAEERLAAEAKAADDKEAAEKAAEEKRIADEKTAAKGAADAAAKVAAEGKAEAVAHAKEAKPAAKPDDHGVALKR